MMSIRMEVIKMSALKDEAVEYIAGNAEKRDKMEHDYATHAIETYEKYGIESPDEETLKEMYRTEMLKYKGSAKDE